jgi:hypothetical protein
MPQVLVVQTKTPAAVTEKGYKPMITAVVAKVQIGTVEIDGLMDEEGNFYVGMPQLTDINLMPRRRSAKQLEALSDKAFSSQTDIVKLKTPLHSKGVNALPVKLVEKLLLKLAIRGNEKAIELMEALIGLSLHQLFSDAFGLKFEKDDRQRWLNCRFQTKHDFRALTDRLQKYGFEKPEEYGKFIHLMQKKIGLADGTRNKADYEILNKLQKAQDILTAYMDCGLKPYDALAKYNPK